jgi:hypothetical protein
MITVAMAVSSRRAVVRAVKGGREAGGRGVLIFD